MTRKQRDLILLALLAILVNGVVAILVARPSYVDAYYYASGAARLADGVGWSEPYIWNYAYAPEALPVPAFGYWQPFAALLGAAGVHLLGWLWPPFGAMQAVYVLAAALLPLLAYGVAYQIGERRQALRAGLFTVFSGIYVVFWSLPETFTPFAVAGAGALALAGWGRQQQGGRWLWLAAGIAAGLAHLTRADGLLVLPVLLGAAFTVGGATHPRARWWNGALCVGGYMLVMGPWLARNVAVYGSLTGAPGGLGALWLVEYNDLFNYPTNLSPRHYLAAGWQTIIRQKGQALLANLATFVGVHNLVFLTPLTVVGAWRRWRDDAVWPALVYGGLLFAAMTFAFSLVGARGGWFHSGAALVPFVMALAAVGLDDAVNWIGRRRAWRLAEARRVFGAASVGFAVLITGAMILTRVVGTHDLTRIAWNSSGQVYERIGARLDTLDVPASAYVMSNNPPGVYWHTGHGGVPLPNGDEDTLLQAADQYDVAWLIVDHNVPEPLEAFYWQGPVSPRFDRVARYGDPQAPVYLYRITAP